MGQDILETLDHEVKLLLQKLSGNPDFQRLEAVRQLIAVYRDTDSPSPARRAQVGVQLPILDNTPPPLPESPPPASMSARIASFAENYLRKKGSPATSGEIGSAMIESGFDIDPKRRANLVSAALSSKNKKFNNGENGYGLLEWAQSGNVPIRHRERPKA